MKIKGIAICILAVLGLSGCNTNEAPYVYPTEYPFEYAVSGASRANITYQDLKGNYIEITNVALPWNYQTYYYDFMVEDKTPVYLSAQSLDTGASVTVTINAKGVLYKTDDSIAEFGFAVVYGTLP